jgi:hypothetical protein
MNFEEWKKFNVGEKNLYRRKALRDWFQMKIDKGNLKLDFILMIVLRVGSNNDFGFVKTSSITQNISSSET